MSQMTDEERRAERQARLDAKALVEIAQNLRAIVDMYGRLETELVYKGVDSDAMTYAGPVANLEAWEHRYEAAEARAALNDQAFNDYATDQEAEWHPLLVLSTWVDLIREERDQPTDLRATVKREADYLSKSAAWFFEANDETGINFPPVDALMNDLQRVRTVLENVLKDGVRHDTGVPCMRCGTVLIKVYAAKEDGSDDHWECSRCQETTTIEQYKIAVKQAYLAEAKRLTATDMLEAYRIKPGSLTAWATKGLVKKRGKDESGRVLYDVQQALAQRDGTGDEDEAA